MTTTEMQALTTGSIVMADKWLVRVELVDARGVTFRRWMASKQAFSKSTLWMGSDVLRTPTAAELQRMGGR